jgi:ribosomal protein L11 methyltransferase
MAGHLSDGGIAILSGLLNEQADEIITVYARSGINLVQSSRIGDWSTLVLRKFA